MQSQKVHVLGNHNSSRIDPKGEVFKIFVPYEARVRCRGHVNAPVT